MSQRDEERRVYLQTKRLEVLSAIKPKCEAFGIEEYDYLITEDLQEYLVLNGQKICCNSNSVWGVEQELIGYIFVKYWKHTWGAFEKQTKNVVTQYWKKSK